MTIKKKKEVRNYLGLALIPQAGVAIGLAAMGARTIGGELGSALQTIILASSVLYELIGPACAKLSLFLSKSYSTKLEDVTTDVPPTTNSGEQKTAAQLLIERIQNISNKNKFEISQEEKEENAFNEAGEEDLEMYYNDFRNRNLRRRL